MAKYFRAMVNAGIRVTMNSCYKYFPKSDGNKSIFSFFFNNDQKITHYIK